MFINLKNKTIYLLIGTTLLSLLFNFFFLWKHWGISILIFNTLLLVISYFALKDKPTFKRNHFLICGTILMLLAIPFVRFDFWLFKVMNTLIMIFLYGFLANGLFELNLGHLIKTILASVFMPLTQLHAYTKDSSSHALKNSKTFKKVMLGIIFASLVCIVVLPLLLSSDTVFNSKLSNAFSFMDFVEVNKFIVRVIFFFLFSSYLYAQFKYTSTSAPKTDGQKSHYRFDPIISNVFLICIDLVYVLFCYIQVKYLFMGNVLPNDMSYSEYARQGFFQLVFVTAINMFIIILFNKLKQHHLFTNCLLILTVACTYIMTFSAFYRMSLYEATFGYTRLRLLVDLFLIGEILVLIPILIGILQPKFKFLEIAFLSIFVYYLAITFINVDAFVADQNIQRYTLIGEKSKEDFDINYLDNLSKDALPKIDELIQSADEETARYFKETILIKYIDNYYESKWYEYNYSNDNLYYLYEKYFPKGYDPNNVPSHLGDELDY